MGGFRLRALDKSKDEVESISKQFLPIPIGTTWVEICKSRGTLARGQKGEDKYQWLTRSAHPHAYRIGPRLVCVRKTIALMLTLVGSAAHPATRVTPRTPCNPVPAGVPPIPCSSGSRSAHHQRAGRPAPQRQRSHCRRRRSHCVRPPIRSPKWRRRKRSESPRPLSNSQTAAGVHGYQARATARARVRAGARVPVMGLEVWLLEEPQPKSN